MAADRPASPPDGTPRLSPYLYYRNVRAALDFLDRAFGFRERMKLEKDGEIVHAEVELDGAVVMVGCPGPSYRNPTQLGQTTQSLYVYVDDVDRHCERAQAAGARIVAEPADQFYGDRRYGAVDPEGHEWFFAQHVRDVSEEEMRAQL